MGNFLSREPEVRMLGWHNNFEREYPSPYVRFMGHLTLGEKLPRMDSPCIIFNKDAFGGDLNRHRRFKVGGRPLQAHRVSYMEFVGSIPDGLHVCHECDVPACVNHTHLFLGTNQDNIADKVAKNRQLQGESHHHSKLTDVERARIRRLCSEGDYKLRQIAVFFGIDTSTVGAIKYSGRYGRIKRPAEKCAKWILSL